jgi:hypothetical protein
MEYIKVITKLPNSEQSHKGKVQTHNYINRQNQSTTGNGKSEIVTNVNFSFIGQDIKQTYLHLCYILFQAQFDKRDEHREQSWNNIYLYRKFAEFRGIFNISSPYPW